MTQNKVNGKQKKSSKSDSSSACVGNSPLDVEDFQIQQARQRSSSLLVLPELSPSTTEDVAVSNFFDNFVFVPRHPDTVRGYMECLLPLYNVTLHGSLLHRAVASVALAIAGGNPRHSQAYTLARSIFVQALQSTNEAIRDPEESIKDETLMSVLMLGLYEVSLSIQPRCFPDILPKYFYPLLID